MPKDKAAHAVLDARAEAERKQHAIQPGTLIVVLLAEAHLAALGDSPHWAPARRDLWRSYRLLIEALLHANRPVLSLAAITAAAPRLASAATCANPRDNGSISVSIAHLSAQGGGPRCDRQEVAFATTLHPECVRQQGSSKP